MMLRDNIIGAWTLVSYVERHGHDGPNRYPLGQDATGLIMYTPDGYMSAQIMAASRTAYDRASTDGGTPAQAVGAATGYLAYSGPFTVEQSTAEIHHGVTVSLLPNWVGHTQIRHSRLNGAQLTLSAESTFDDGPIVYSTLVWTRAPRHSG